MTKIEYAKQTTLITGASSGIGAQFARELAAKGSDLVLVARRIDRLEALARGVERDYGVHATVIGMDLALPAAGILLAEEVNRRGIVVTSLINNAGFGTHGFFHETDIDRIRDEIALNVSNLVGITHAFINDLRKAGNGFLINIASTGAYLTAPTMAVYGATKTFVLVFTEALWYETRGTGLKVIAVSPGSTESEFLDVAGSTANGGTKAMPTASVIGTALKTLDKRNPPPSVVVGRLNKLSVFVPRFVSRRRMATTIGSVMTRALAAG